MVKLIVVRNDDDRPNQSRWQLKFTNVYLFHLTFTFNRFIVYAEERQSIVVVVSEGFFGSCYLLSVRCHCGHFAFFLNSITRGNFIKYTQLVWVGCTIKWGNLYSFHPIALFLALCVEGPQPQRRRGGTKANICFYISDSDCGSSIYVNMMKFNWNSYNREGYDTHRNVFCKCSMS